MRKRAVFRRSPRAPDIVTDTGKTERQKGFALRSDSTSGVEAVEAHAAKRAEPSAKEKEAGSALPFTPRPAGVANVIELGRRCEHSRTHAPGHFIHDLTGLPQTTKREIQSRFPQLLVPKTAI